MIYDPLLLSAQKIAFSLKSGKEIYFWGGHNNTFFDLWLECLLLRFFVWSAITEISQEILFGIPPHKSDRKLRPFLLKIFFLS